MVGCFSAARVQEAGVQDHHWLLCMFSFLFLKVLFLINYYTRLAFIRDYLGDLVPERYNQEGITNLDLLEQVIVSGSGISWAIYKSALRPRQITMPAFHQSRFLQARCPSCCPTNSVKALKVYLSTFSWNFYRHCGFSFAVLISLWHCIDYGGLWSILRCSIEFILLCFDLMQDLVVEVATVTDQYHELPLWAVGI